MRMKRRGKVLAGRSARRRIYIDRMFGQSWKNQRSVEQKEVWWSCGEIFSFKFSQRFVPTNPFSRTPASNFEPLEIEKRGPNGSLPWKPETQVWGAAG